MVSGYLNLSIWSYLDDISRYREFGYSEKYSYFSISQVDIRVTSLVDAASTVLEKWCHKLNISVPVCKVSHLVIWH